MTESSRAFRQPRSGPLRFGFQRALPVGLLVVVAAAYSLLVLAYLRQHDAVSNLDYWRHIDIGRGLNFRQAATLADGLYPLGYPLVLRLAIQSGADVLRAGQVLAWFGGLLAIVGLYGLTYSMTRRPFLACAGAILLITNLNFLGKAGYEGNDMLAAGLQVLALWLAWLMADRVERREGAALAVAAGVTAGLAYLARYPALLLLPILLLLAVAQPKVRRRRGFIVAGTLLAAFALTTLIQTLPAALAHGNPFHNLQAKNVWFGIYGQRDWVNNWGKAPDTIGLVEVLALGPQAFLVHWWQEFSRFFWQLPLWSRFWHVAWLAGAVHLLFYRRMPLARRLILLAALFAPVAATAMAWLDARFLLVALVMQALLILLLADSALALTPARARPVIYPVAIGLFALALLPGGREALAWAQQPGDRHAAAIDGLLRSAGMTDPTLVATNDPYLHAVDDPARTRYAQAYMWSPAPQSAAELLERAEAEGWRYLALDHNSGMGNYAAIRDASPAERERLTPLLLDGPLAIYCIEPCAAMVAEGLRFDNGMELMGQSVVASEAGTGVFLQWRAADRVPGAYKVSVRLLDAGGNTLDQVDNVPQVWSRPTETWRPGEVVNDFYRLAPSEGAARLAIVVYESGSGQPVMARDPEGNSLGPLIPLQAR